MGNIVLCSVGNIASAYLYPDYGHCQRGVSGEEQENMPDEQDKADGHSDSDSDSFWALPEGHCQRGVSQIMGIARGAFHL